VVSLEAQEHGPDYYNGIEIFREIIELESYNVQEASNYPKDLGSNRFSDIEPSPIDYLQN